MIQVAPVYGNRNYKKNIEHYFFFGFATAFLTGTFLATGFFTTFLGVFTFFGFILFGVFTCFTVFLVSFFGFLATCFLGFFSEFSLSLLFQLSWDSFYLVFLLSSLFSWSPSLVS